MQNFVYDTPTKVYFGKDEELNVGKILAEYAVEDVVYASPLAKKSVQTDAEGNFSIQWHETKSNVAYALKVVDDSADGVEYNPYFMELNVFSGSPSYDQSTGTYKVSGLKIYMTQAASQ